MKILWGFIAVVASSVLALPDQVPVYSLGNKGSYARGFIVGTDEFYCFGHVVDGMKQLSIIKWPDTSIIGTVTQANASTDDLANCYVKKLNSTTLMAVFRHHTGCSDKCMVYTLGTAFGSVDGTSWRPGPTIVKTFPPTGVWEPILVDFDDGLYVAYAHELQESGQLAQEIAQQRWNGSGWEMPTRLYHREGSRDGMPGIARVGNSSVFVAVFEGFWTGKWGQFTVNGVVSRDGGKTFAEPSIIYAPPNAKAGAPQVAYRSGNLIMSCMTNADNPNAGDWPTSAAALALQGTSISAMKPFKVFGPYNSYWPGLVEVDSNTVIGLVGNSTGLYRTQTTL